MPFLAGTDPVDLAAFTVHVLIRDPEVRRSGVGVSSILLGSWPVEDHSGGRHAGTLSAKTPELQCYQWSELSADTGDVAAAWWLARSPDEVAAEAIRSHRDLDRDSDRRNRDQQWPTGSGCTWWSATTPWWRLPISGGGSSTPRHFA
jgi:hypothetical protein